MNASVQCSQDASGSVTQAWLRALELTSAIPRNPDRVLPAQIGVFAERFGDAPALFSDIEHLTYAELARRQNQYGRWALTQGVSKGDVVGLLMANSPDYVAIWLGISSIGGITALLNTNLVGQSLARCINAARPSHLIVSADYADALESALPYLAVLPAIWMSGAEHRRLPRIDQDIESQSGNDVAGGQQQPLSIEDQALYIFTSGTTGLPKAAKVSHARVLQWSYWFAGMLGVQPNDRMYNCLPMYHSIGGVLAPGAMLVGGGSVYIQRKFSATQFWTDVIRQECTIFQYIGELCRYLLHSTSPLEAAGHRLRVASGNGMAPAVWDEFKKRFQIPRIFEFYASTEGGVSLFNAEGKSGSIGRVPPYLSHRYAPALALIDSETGKLVRDNSGFCVPCVTNQVGEALGKHLEDPSAIGSRFEGYTEERASADKILRNVFAPGDAWVRTGDLMRKDARGFYYFVDRAGDTFRWKGENVSTTEVSEVLCTFPGVRHANVYGVAVSAGEGCAGMAALVADDHIDFCALWRHLTERLPAYACPLFLRFRDSLDVTGTLKYTKVDLARQGYDPSVIGDRLYFNHREVASFVPLDALLYSRIKAGEIRL